LRHSDGLPLNDLLEVLRAPPRNPFATVDQGRRKLSGGRGHFASAKDNPVISAVSPAKTRPEISSSTSTGWHFAPIPDLNRVTKHAISQHCAWPAFIGICMALRQEGRRGATSSIRQAAKDQQRVGIGLRELARDLGINVGTVRRQVGRLVEIGVIVRHRPNVEIRADLATGKIVSKAKGRCENTLIYLTILPKHLRPAKAVTGAKRTQPTVVLKVHNQPTFIESKNQRVPDGQADGVGRPQPQEEGGHSAAKAGREEIPILPMDAGRDEPVMPIGRVIGSPKTSPAPRRTNRYQDDQRPPQVWVGPEEQARKAMQARLAAEQAERDRRDAEAKTTAQAAPQEVPETDPETDLRRAVESLPPAKRERCRRLGRDAKTAADQAAAEAAMLLEIVRQRTGQDAASDEIAKDAKAETYRDLYRREKSAQKAVTA
jgi:hypothetical protein